MKVRVCDFNILVNVVVDIPVGVTIISGHNSSGKSSLLKAIHNAVYNVADPSTVRSWVDGDGKVCSAGELLVRFHLDDGRMIEWYYGKETRYVITESDGTERVVGKLGGATYDEVVKLLGFDEIVIDDEKIRINFWGQDEGAFLLDKGPTKLFNILAYSEEQKVVDDILDTIKVDIREQTNSVRDLGVRIDMAKGQIVDYKEDVEKLSWVDTFGPTVDRLEELEPAVDQLGKFIDTYRGLDEEITRRTLDVGRLISVKTYVLPDVSDLERRISLCDDVINKYGRSVTLVSTYDSMVTSGKVLVSNLEAAVGRLESLESTTTDLKSKLDLISQYKSKLAEIGILERAVNTARDVVHSIQKEIGDIKVCEYCGQEILV